MKRPQIIIIAMVSVLALATMACGFSIGLPDNVRGNGNVTEEMREIDGFDEIEINGLGEIVVELGEEPSLRVEAEENLLRHLETYNRGNRLVIEIEEDINIIPTEPVRFYVTAVSLQAVDVSGLGSIRLPEIEAERFSISISGVGDIEIAELYAESFVADMSGLGDLTVRGGEVASQEIDISGGGSYNGSSLEGSEVEVDVSGVGSATVRVSDYLKVSISGGGSVKYYGSPQTDINISGVGNLDRLGD